MATYRLSITKDAEVRSALPNNNYGSSNTFSIGAVEGNNLSAYLGFTLPEALKGKKIKSASLVMTPGGMVSGANTTSAINTYSYNLANDFVETSITYATRPANVGNISIGIIPKYDTSPTSVNLKECIQYIADNANAIPGILVTGGGNAYAANGRNITGNPPYILVETNEAPVWSTVPTQTVRKGKLATVNLANYVSDANGDALTYGVASNSDTSVVTASVNSGNILTLAGVATGTAAVTVTANDGTTKVATTVNVNVINIEPTVTLTLPTNNVTLYEKDILSIIGTAYDEDPDQSVTAYYQINSEPRKVLATNLSQTQIALSKQLTFKGGKIYDGETVLTGTLTDGIAHTLKVWAEDSEKASSVIVERTFYVVPNRAPLLSVEAVAPSGVIDADNFKISGTASDQDANSTVKVTIRINAGNAIEIYSGAGGAWEFVLALSQLVVGQNTIVIEVIDNYGAKTSKTVTLNKKEMKTPILQSVARYKIEPPKGSAKGVLLFIQRDEELDIKVELSMTLNGEQEQYETLTPANTAPVQQGVVEDTFEYEGLEAKQNIILKITPSRTDLSFNHKIHLISGAVD
ncbi:DNRLRE domain-containing protein [Lysinibacillus sp. NPDC097162]|uniref:DNRLRE domain-containing protein n=1 Tax=Lysinibacillus sp. NPDC097162 TaxID=3364140 RepID=UPI003818F101